MRGGQQHKRQTNPARSGNGFISNDHGHDSNKIDWIKTFIQIKGKPERQSELAYKSLKNQALINHVVVWDTSASTLRNKAAAKAKGIIVKLFEQAYLNRQRIGLLEFSADQVSVITPCQRVNRDLIVPKISALTIGGNTPVNRALTEAVSMLRQANASQPNSVSKLTLITDGYFNELPARPALDAHYIIIDINQASVRIGKCEDMAFKWGAQLINSTDLV